MRAMSSGILELGCCGVVVAAMAGTRHKRLVSEFMQQVVEGGNRQTFAEAGFDEVPEIDPPQRARIVRPGTVLDPLGEQRLLFGVEDLRTTASGVILQSGKSLGVVAFDPLLDGASGQAALQCDLWGSASQGGLSDDPDPDGDTRAAFSREQILKFVRGVMPLDLHLQPPARMTERIREITLRKSGVGLNAQFSIAM